MQQRVALARLLQTGADIMLLDEPFGALDEFTRERLNVELLRIVDDPNITTVFVTHNITEAIFLGDQVFVMTPRPGRIAAQIEIDLPKPRSIEMETTPEFQKYVQQVRDVLASHLEEQPL
jgi:NitT/TauT family transport system ATP-binding protein